MKKNKLIFALFFVVILLGGIWYAWHVYHIKQINSISEYEDLLKQSESTSSDNIPPKEKVTLTTMLYSGIFTLNGIIQSISESNNGVIANYQIYVNGNPIGVKSVSEIELVKAFLLNGNQILLLGFDQGGNQCARQYQFVTISESDLVVSKVFGSCMPISHIEYDGDAIKILTPQNNPYLGDDINYIYKYSAGSVELYSKPNKTSLKSKYANLTALQIIQKATADGCYQDGVLLDDGACGGGRKYCTMFKNMNNPTKDANYKLLKDFCN